MACTGRGLNRNPGANAPGPTGFENKSFLGLPEPHQYIQLTVIIMYYPLPRKISGVARFLHHLADFLTIR
jgi:hypothetical protein